MIDPPIFNPYRYLNQINDLLAGEEPAEPETRVQLSDQYRATDIGVMLKTALRAIDLIAEKIGSDRTD